MIAWRPFTYQGVTYSLDHLHPKEFTFTQPGKGALPALDYQVRVAYGLHCFTRGSKPNDVADPTLRYGDSREDRIFDFDRYGWSQQLPEIVAALPRTKCFHTGHGNFFVVRQVDAATGLHVDYEVYFNAVRSSVDGNAIDLYIQSAYVRDKLHRGRPAAKPIGFFVILFNRQKNRLINAPP